MATATRRSQSLTTLYTTAKESWYNPGKAEEIIFEPTPLLWIMSQKCKKTGAWGFDTLVRLLDSKNGTVDSFSGFQELDTAASKGPQAARFSMANYAAAIAMSWEEEVENKEPNRLADLLQFRIEQAELSLADRLAKDMYKGNVAKSTNLLGLEQLCPAYGSNHAPGGATDTWQYRQGANSYGNITRTAWTTANAGGTGWESLVVDFDGSATAGFQYSSTAPYAPGVGLKELNDLYTFCSKGIIHPDLGLFSPHPFRDYENCGMTKQQISKDSASFGDLQLGYDNLKYKNAVIIRDEMATTQNATGAISDDTFNKQNFYLLNTKFLELRVEEGCDFEFTDEVPAQNQLAGVFFIVWRGQVLCVNPRYQGRGYAYLAAA